MEFQVQLFEKRTPNLVLEIRPSSGSTFTNWDQDQGFLPTKADFLPNIISVGLLYRISMDMYQGMYIGM